MGETLLSEGKFHAERNEGLFEILRSEKEDLTKKAYEEARTRAILSRPQGESSRVRAIAREVLGTEGFYTAVNEYHESVGARLVKQFKTDPMSLFQPYPEVQEVLDSLSKRHSLGVIANQHRNVRRSLEKIWHIAKYFDFMILSEEVGFKKPDKEMFLLALDKARADASEAWMIGDRVDTDVGPSRSLGMKAIRVLHDSEMSIIPPISDEEIPDFQFKDLRPLLNLF